MTTATAVRELPIGFKPELRKAILNTNHDRSPVDPDLPVKWVTRRLVNITCKHPVVRVAHNGLGFAQYDANEFNMGFVKPKYQCRDNLYLTEPTQVIDIVSYRVVQVKYEDGVIENKRISEKDYAKLLRRKDWNAPCNQRFMLKAFARHWIEVDDVRVERLQDIAEAEAIGEGVEKFRHGKEQGEAYKNYTWELSKGMDYRWHKTAIESFASLWDLIHTEFCWCDNPWVFVYTFHRL